jgi:hypothetical protein
MVYPLVRVKAYRHEIAKKEVKEVNGRPSEALDEFLLSADRSIPQIVAASRCVFSLHAL